MRDAEISDLKYMIKQLETALAESKKGITY